MGKFIKDGEGHYIIQGQLSADDIVKKAQSITTRRMRRSADVLSSPACVREYLHLHFAQGKQEVFWAMFLDNRHRVLKHEILFYGTIDAAAVYPREVVRRAIELNAAAIIFAHNHPSGVPEPSDTDVRLTKMLIDALALIDTRVLDHLIVGESVVSMAERGLM